MNGGRSPESFHSVRQSRRICAGESQLQSNRTCPPNLYLSQTILSAALSSVPCKPTISIWPICRSSSVIKPQYHMLDDLSVVVYISELRCLKRSIWWSKDR